MDSWNEELVHFAVIDDGATPHVHSFFENQPKSLASVVFNKTLSQQLIAGPSGNLADLEQEISRLSGGAILAIDFELGFLNDRRDEIRRHITEIVDSTSPRHPRANEALDSLALVGDQIDGFDIAVRALKQKSIEKLLLIVATSRGNHATFATVLEVVGECLGRTPNSLKVDSLHGGRSFSRTSSEKTAQGIHAAVRVYDDTWGRDRHLRQVGNIWVQAAADLSREVFPQDYPCGQEQHNLLDLGFVANFESLHKNIEEKVEAVRTAIAKSWNWALRSDACDVFNHSTITCQRAGAAKAISKYRVPLPWVLSAWGLTEPRNSHLFGVVVHSASDDTKRVRALRAVALLYYLWKLIQGHNTFEYVNAEWELTTSEDRVIMRSEMMVRDHRANEAMIMENGMNALRTGWQAQQPEFTAGREDQVSMGETGSWMHAIALNVASRGQFVAEKVDDKCRLSLTLEVRSGVS